MLDETAATAEDLIRLSKLHNITRVVVESPYAGNVEHNIEYALAAMRDSLDRGEAPTLSHLLYTRVWSDKDETLRSTGILVGHSWMLHAHLVAVYTDLGISPGMKRGIKTASQLGRIIVYRSLPDWEQSIANNRHP